MNHKYKGIFNNHCNITIKMDNSMEEYKDFLNMNIL